MAIIMHNNNIDIMQLTAVAYYIIFLASNGRPWRLITRRVSVCLLLNAHYNIIHIEQTSYATGLHLRTLNRKKFNRLRPACSHHTVSYDIGFLTKYRLSPTSKLTPSDDRCQIETCRAVGGPAAQHRLHIQLGLVRGARFAGGKGHYGHRTGRSGTRVDHEPATEVGPRRRADGHCAPYVRDAHARAGPDDRHRRDNLQKGVHDWR